MKSVHESQILHMGRSASKILSLTEEEFYEVRLGLPVIKGPAERDFLFQVFMYMFCLNGQWHEIFFWLNPINRVEKERIYNFSMSDHY